MYLVDLVADPTPRCQELSRRISTEVDEGPERRLVLNRKRLLGVARDPRVPGTRRRRLHLDRHPPEMIGVARDDVDAWRCCRRTSPRTRRAGGSQRRRRTHRHARFESLRASLCPLGWIPAQMFPWGPRPVVPARPTTRVRNSFGLCSARPRSDNAVALEGFDRVGHCHLVHKDRQNIVLGRVDLGPIRRLVSQLQRHLVISCFDRRPILGSRQPGLGLGVPQ